MYNVKKTTGSVVVPHFVTTVVVILFLAFRLVGILFAGATSSLLVAEGVFVPSRNYLLPYHACLPLLIVELQDFVFVFLRVREKKVVLMAYPCVFFNPLY